MKDGPYRSAPTKPLYVCLVCCRSLAVHAGSCRECGVDRLPLADPRVRDELRLEAERRLQKRMYAEYFGLSLLAFVMTLPINLYLTGFVGRVIWVFAALAVARLNTRLYAVGRPGSALAVFVDRRRRLARDFGLDLEGDVKVLPGRSISSIQSLVSVSADDPDMLDLDRVLDWLGARLDEEPTRLR